MPSKIGPRKPFTHYIAEHREKKGWTQEKLASVIGCGPMTVYRWENYKVRVDYPILAAVAEALYGDMGEAEDILHHPDRPTPNQLLRRMPADDRNHFIKQMKRAVGED